MRRQESDHRHCGLLRPCANRPPFVGAREEGLRYVEAEGLGGFQIDL
jgi:hypothetical protein